MARRFLDDIRSDIASQFADNSNGNISPADLRSVTVDMLDSSVQDECDIFSTAPTVGLVLNGTFSDLTTIYDGQEGGDGLFLIPSFASGMVAGTSTPGFTYVVIADITVEASNNEEIDFSIGINGVATGFIGSVVGDGMRDQSVRVENLDRTAPASAVYTLMARAADGAATPTIQDVILRVIIVPTNNP